jgi:photosynthetic reaction center H subunit
MNVVAADNVVAGTVSEVWVDRSEYMVRYIEVQLANSSKRVLVPMTMVVVQGGRKRVKVNALLASQFENIPQLSGSDQITRDEEERVCAYVGAGTLYATPARTEAWL